MNTESTEYQYWAFISYSSKDRDWAKWLHTKLENYWLPVQLVQHLAPVGQPAPKHLKPMFWDRAELQAHHDLGELIERSLRGSRYLIVICSPNAAQSPWVEKEIQTFQEMHGPERILALIVGGEPNVADATNCFPPTLRAREPKAPDARKQGDGKTNSKLMILATMLDVPFDALKRRDRQRKRRLIAIGLACMLFFAWIVWQAILAKQQETLATQLAERERERSLLEEGRAWLERAQTAEVSKKPFLATLMAGRAVGYRGYGWRDEDQVRFGGEYPALIGQTFRDLTLEEKRLEEVSRVADLIARQYPSGLPIWSSPISHSNFNQQGIYGLDFSPNGIHIATGSLDGKVQLWDLVTGTLVTTFSGHSKWVTDLAFSPDGSRLVSSSEDSSLKVWDVKSGGQLVTLSGHLGPVHGVAFSPDGRQIVSGAEDRRVILWDSTTGELIRALGSHDLGVVTVDFSPYGERIASGSLDHTIKLWDPKKGAEVSTLRGHTARVFKVAFSPDGRLLASGSEDETVKIWDAATGREIATLAGHSLPVSSVAFSPDSGLIVSGSGDKTVKVWDAVTKKELATFHGHNDGVYEVAFSDDGRMIASGSRDGTVKLWDASRGRQFLSLSNHLQEVTALAIGPDGRQIASGSQDKTVRLWDRATGEELSTLTGHSGTIRCVSFSADGLRVGSGSHDKTAKVWDVATGTELASLTGHSDKIYCIAFSPDGGRVATGSRDNSVKLWDIATAKEIVPLGHSGSMPQQNKGVIVVADVAKLLRDLEARPGHADVVTCVAFSPDGLQVVSGSRDKTLKLWNSSTGKEIATLEGHDGWVESVSFSPDGRHIASASDKTVILWDASSFNQVAILKHAEDVDCVAFSTDSLHLASGTWSKEVKLWDVSTGHEIRGRRPNIPMTGLINCIGPNGEVRATKVGDRIDLEYTAPLRPDLMHLQRQNLFVLQGHEVLWHPASPSSNKVETFTPMQYRGNSLEALAQMGLDANEAQKQRMLLMAAGGRWEAASLYWRSLADANAEVRQIFLTLLIVSAKQSKSPATRLIDLITVNLNESSAGNPLVSLPLVEFFKSHPAEGATDEESAACARLLLKTMDVASAPIVTAIGNHIFRKTSSTNDGMKSSVWLKWAFKGDDQMDVTLSRGAIGLLPVTDPSWEPAMSRLLVHPDSSLDDVIGAILKALKMPDGKEVALSMLRRARTNVTNHKDSLERICFGFVILNEPTEALSAAEIFVKSEQDQEPQFFLGMLCHSIALHLIGKENESIASYRRLIQAAHSVDSELDLTAPEFATNLGNELGESGELRDGFIRSLDDLRKATLAKYPELAAKPR